jgi:hypothetical protein
MGDMLARATEQRVFSFFSIMGFESTLICTWEIFLVQIAIESNGDQCLILFAIPRAAR